MPRKYQKKNAVEPFDGGRMLTAIKLVKGNPPVSIQSVAASYNLNRSTLNRYIKRFNDEFPPAERNFTNITDDEAMSFLISCSALGAKPLFNAEQEEELVSYIEKFSKLNYGLTLNNIRKLAFEFAVKYGLKYPAGWNQSGRASEDWCYGFMSRHNDLSLRKPGSTSARRTERNCRKNVNLKAVLDETPFTMPEIWNLDENGFATEPKQTAKVVSGKGAKPLFNAKQERELVSYIIRCSKLNYGLSINNIRKLAFEFANKCGLAYPAVWDQFGRATEDWYYGFMGRHSNLSLRQSGSTSAHCAKGFCRENVDKFFYNFKTVLDETPFTALQIWNVDEMVFSTVPKQTMKVVAERGAKHVGQHAGAERGTNVTVIIGVNASGRAIPPMFLFPRKNMKTIFMDNAPPDAVGFANESGWITSADFVTFIRHFIKSTGASKDYPLLLLLDNHAAHMSLEVIDLCIDNGITIVTFPPHCTHRMQPLEVGVFGPLERSYNVKVHEWGQSNAGRTFELHHVSGAVDQAMLTTCTPLNIRKGFELPGIFPVDSFKFTDDDFLVAKISGENVMAEEESASADPNDQRNSLVVLGK